MGTIFIYIWEEKLNKLAATLKPQLMRINEILYKLSLFVGLFILVSGIFLKLTENFVDGYLFQKNGEISLGIIDGNGALFLGFMILAFSFWTYKGFKKEQIDIENRKRIENNELALKKNKCSRETF